MLGFKFIDNFIILIWITGNTCKYKDKLLRYIWHRSQTLVDGSVYKMCCDSESKDFVLALQLTDGFIMKYDIGKSDPYRSQIGLQQ